MYLKGEVMHIGDRSDMEKSEGEGEKTRSIFLTCTTVWKGEYALKYVYWRRTRFRGNYYELSIGVGGV